MTTLGSPPAAGFLLLQDYSLPTPVSAGDQVPQAGHAGVTPELRHPPGKLQGARPSGPRMGVGAWVLS